MNYGGIAALIAALGVFAVGIAATISMLRTSTRVKDTHHMVTQIDGAVNGKMPGETTMVSQVQDLHDHMPGDDHIPEAVLPLLKQLVFDVKELKGEVRRRK